jgi:putative PIN family toxin of toxin-antitoxin system
VQVFPVVVDTNVLVGALLKQGGAARRVVRACLTGNYQPLIGAALFAEYEGLLAREALWANALLSARERDEVFDGFMSVCRWVEVFFAWRPNLPDEADNHLVELAVAGNAVAIVTRNTRDLMRGELRFPALSILTPEQCLEAYPCRP